MKFLTQDDVDNAPWISFNNSDKFANFPSAQAKPTAYVFRKSNNSYMPDCGLINAVANVFDEEGKNFGKLIRYQKKTGTFDTVYISHKELKNNSNALDELVDKGYPLSPDQNISRALQSYLYSIAKTVGFIPYANRTGYYKEFHGFVLPDGLYVEEGKKLVVYGNKNDLPIEVHGDYDIWKKDIAGEMVKYAFPTYVFCVAFSSALYPFVDIGTIFTHFYGLSSRGKTLLLQLAASVYGKGSDPRNDPTGSLISQWNKTPTGLEATAALFNGTVGLLDELHKCEDKAFPKAIYALCGGVDKTRGTSTGGLQQEKTWSFPGLSSGEQSGLEKIQKSKQEATLGRMIRFLDIHLEGQMFTGFETEDAINLAKNTKTLCSEHYGHASRDFMQQLLCLAGDYESLRTIIKRELDDIVSQLLAKEGLEQEEMRVMDHFAIFILAGYYAVRFNILPMTEADVYKSVCDVRDIWLDHMKSHAQKLEREQAEKKDYVAMLKKAILDNVHLYQSTSDLKPMANCKGYYQLTQYSDEYDAYLLKQKTFEEIFRGYNLEDVCDQLCEKNILLRDIKQYKRRYRIKSIIGKDGKSATLRLYTISSSIVDDPEEEVEKIVILDDEEMKIILEHRRKKEEEEAANPSGNLS